MDAVFADTTARALEALAPLAPFAPYVLQATGALFVVMGLSCAALPVAAGRGIGLGVADAKGAIEFRAQYGGGLIGPGAAFAAAGWVGDPFLIPGLAFAIAYLGGLAVLRALSLAAARERSGLMTLFFWVELIWTAALVVTLTAVLVP